MDDQFRVGYIGYTEQGSAVSVQAGVMPLLTNVSWLLSLPVRGLTHVPQTDSILFGMSLYQTQHILVHLLVVGVQVMHASELYDTICRKCGPQQNFSA